MTSFRKSPPADWLPRLARSHARSVNEHNGKAFPATVAGMQGRIALVRLEVSSNPAPPPFRVPVAESEYVRTPIQPGCKGVVLSAKSSLGQMTGLGARRPTPRDVPLNLGSCVFLPLTNAQWAAMDNDTLHMYGVAGVEILNRLNGRSALRLTEDHATLTNGQATVSLDGGKVTLTGELVINGQPYKAHQHSNGNNGSPTGGVI